MDGSGLGWLSRVNGIEGKPLPGTLFSHEPLGGGQANPAWQSINRTVKVAPENQRLSRYAHLRHL